jgi:DNA-binding winged helix-turn-helix (wHTH) protein
MMTLRRKLGEPPIIETVVGSGYRVDPTLITPAEENEEPGGSSTEQ